MEGSQADPAGLATFERVLGRPHGKPLTGIRELTINHLFAHVWNRPGLSMRDRSLITIALLAAAGRPDQLRSHVRGARSRGMTDDEIAEVMIHTAHYAGWPAGVAGQAIADEVAAEDG
ncbi:MAG: carboxymuconolactone decarboxylase family protein [Longimicrobiales bacterium]